jgi:hypothetical protein
MSIYATGFFTLFLSVIINAQGADSLSGFTDKLVDELVPEPLINGEEYEITGYLEDLQSEPVNINKADITTLQKIPGVDLNYALLIIQYREKMGRFFSPYELYSVKGIPIETVKQVIHYIITEEPQKRVNNISTAPYSLFSGKMRSRLTIPAKNNNDFLSRGYPGSGIKLLNKFSLHNSLGEFGFVSEKDPGETSYTDFLSFHLLLKNVGPFEKVIIGDYTFEFGQGIALWGPFGYAKSSDIVTPVKKTEIIIKPYNGSDENHFFRGIASSYSVNNFLISFFYSNHKRDATIDSSMDCVSSLLSSGYHRTTTEIKNHNSVREISSGLRGDYIFNDIVNIGLLYCESTYSLPFANNSLYSPRGKKFNHLSFKYDSYPFSNINLSGEFAYDFKSVASLNTIQISFNKDFLFVSSFRNYPVNYISLSGNSLSEQGGILQNETGFYNGFKLFTDLGLFNLYFDQFRFPSGGYNFPISHSGEELHFTYSKTFEDNLILKFHYKYENKDYMSEDPDYKIIVRRLRNDYRFSLDWELNELFRLKTSVEYNAVFIKDNNLSEKGILLANSFWINLPNNINLSCSFSFFQTSSYFSSVSELENNIPGLITGRLLYGEGLKLNINASKIFFNSVKITGQYSETVKPIVTEESSAYPVITNSMIFQLDFIF